MAERIRERVVLTQQWRIEFGNLLDSKGVVSAEEISRDARVERHVIAELTDPRPGDTRMNPGFVGRVLIASGANEVEQGYFWGSLGRPLLPLYPVRSVFNRRERSVGVAVDSILTEYGFDQAQEQRCGDAIVPFTQRVAAHVNNN